MSRQNDKIHFPVAYPDYYADPGVRETCHAVKDKTNRTRQILAIAEIALGMASRGLVKPGDHLIPAPQHSGRAEYTLEIARYVAKDSGAEVLDIVRCDPHEPLYDLKARAGEGGDCIVPDPDLRFFLEGEESATGKLFFVDNVISTGRTYREVSELFDKLLVPLVFAVDYGTLELSGNAGGKRC